MCMHVSTGDLRLIFPIRVISYYDSDAAMSQNENQKNQELKIFLK